ncbi:MAG: PTS lactose/cellobiose transporter subunit IIA [Solobacterium sp.]|jgi:PTS system cellobiose-specific IIA component|nr:PTS lactose/cellobiose transporter subunit IIA [Solobacterium sp.]MCH4282079.1 PTS lactose/cellobiose transporter subunit IIA [Solobacterium sp.]
MEGTELIAFNIIATVGTARSSYISAIDAAAEGNFDEAEKLIKEGQDAYVEGHDAHAKLLTQTAQGNAVTMDLLLTHAEDQLMSAEAFGILAERFVTLYKKIYNK